MWLKVGKKKIKRNLGWGNWWENTSPSPFQAIQCPRFRALNEISFCHSSDIVCRSKRTDTENWLGPAGGMARRWEGKEDRKAGVRRSCATYVLCQASLLRTAFSILFCGRELDRVSKKPSYSGRKSNNIVHGARRTLKGHQKPSTQWPWDWESQVYMARRVGFSGSQAITWSQAKALASAYHWLYQTYSWF